MTLDEWRARGAELFGEDALQWKFICPSCKTVIAVHEWQAAGAPQNAVAFSCVGRWLPKSKEAFFGGGEGPCNYAGGGLIGINPVKIEGRAENVFDFSTPNGCHEKK